MDKTIYITWLGQGGFLFETDGTRLLVDPFLSNIVEIRQGLKRLREAPLTIDELKPNCIFITHDHLDHLDPIALPQIHKSYPDVIIGGPQSVITKCKELGIDSSVLLEVSKNKTYQFINYKITITPAYHSDPFSVGCIIRVNEKQIYLSGDTIFSEKLVSEIKSLASEKIDAVIVCINGKLGNMKWFEATSLVKELRPAKAIPMHYGMFSENTEDPKPFIESFSNMDIDAFELTLGEKTKLFL